MREYSFITKFIECFNEKHSSKAIQPSGPNQSTYADCEIILYDEIVKIEAKLLNDTNSNSTDFYNLIGEIIGTFKKQSLLQEQGEEKKKFCMGVLVPFKSKIVFNDLWHKNITPNGVKYCEAFNVKYLITFNEETNDIEILTFDTKNDRWI